MTGLVSSDGILFGYLAILVYGRKIALFTELLTFLAVVSVAVWGIVLASTLLRFSMKQLYKLRMRRSLNTRG
jgi:hypothetical protein